MRIGFHIDISDFTRFEAKMRDGLNVSSPGSYQDGMVAASDAYHSAMRERFIDASNRDGTWAELAPSTERAHTRIGDVPYHILHFYGDLEKSLYRDDENHVLEITLFSVIEGTSDFKAEWHQYGTSRMPARIIYIEPDDGTLSDMKEKIVEGIQKLVNS